MKNFLLVRKDYERHNLQKKFKILKISLVLSLLFMFHVSATTKSQVLKINLAGAKFELTTAVDAVEGQCDYNFFYSENEVDIHKKLKLNLKNADVDEVVKHIFGSEFNYRVSGKLIVIAKKSAAEIAEAMVFNKIKGTIKDKDGVLLPGVSVIVVGTQRGIDTDFDGNYSIEANEGDVLEFSYIGMVTQKITVGKQTVIDVVMQSDTSELDEVVLVSFGQQKKRNVVGSITTVKPSELKAPTSNLTTALAGRVSGLIAYQRGGEPGRDNAEFFIRGVTTFGYGSSPLILIDGVELTITDLKRLHPDDIAAFSIMKDASATALYGARGANGVIYVTTKEGTEGPVSISARIETSISQATKNIELADPITYMRLGNEAVKTRDPLGLLPYSLEKIDNTIAGTNSTLYPVTDWQKELFQDFALSKRFNFSLNGGGKTARYYLSVAGSEDNGNLKVPKVSNFNSNVSYKQYTIRSNTNIELTETSKLKLSFNFSSGNYSGPRYGGADVYNTVMRSNPVFFKPFYEKDAANQFTNHILFGNYGEGNYLNPYAIMVSGYQEGTDTKIISQLEFNQDLDFVTEGLDFKLIFNATKQSNYSIDRFYNPYYYSPRQNRETGVISLNPLNEESGTEYLNYNEGGKFVSSSSYLEANMTYNKDLDDKNSISGLLVFMMNNKLFSNSGSLQKSLPYRNMGLSGRFTYANNNKYFAEFNFGYNGSERFSAAERWGFFPSIGLGWMASDEPFMEKFEDVITKLKIKGSYGLVGNDAIGGPDDRFFYLSQVNLNNGTFRGGYRTGDDFNNYLSEVSIQRYANDQITWETAKKMNIGFELGLLNELDLEVDFFREERSNILADRILPSTLGLQAGVRANIGEAKSQGIDSSLEYNKTFSDGTWLQVRGTFTYATNEITKIEEPDYSATPWLSRVGQPIRQVWGYVAERLFVDQDEVNNSPVQSFGGEYSGGDIKYRDVNGDGRISGLDRVPIGNPTVPDIVYGFGISSGFKGFDVSCFFQGAANSSFWIDPVRTAPFLGNQQQQLLKAYADDYWSETNRDVYALWPRLSENIVNNNVQTSTWFMQDGAFLRLKSAEIGFSLPQNLVEKLNMNKIRLYASGTNLFVLSKFKFWDPELAGNGLRYPNQRVFNLGVNISL